MTVLSENRCREKYSQNKRKSNIFIKNMVLEHQLKQKINFNDCFKGIIVTLMTAAYQTFPKNSPEAGEHYP